MNGKTYQTITLYQPWASMIAQGHKTIETRGHRKFAKLVGATIAIHAGRKFDTRGALEIQDRYFAIPTQSFGYPAGAVICLADVFAFTPLTAHHARQSLLLPRYLEPGKLWGLFLNNVRTFRAPVKCNGSQGVWTWTAPKDLLMQEKGVLTWK